MPKSPKYIRAVEDDVWTAMRIMIGTIECNRRVGRS